MADSSEREREEPARIKPYSRPTLTEYGSVAKLTMAKGITVTEGSGQLKQSCL
jgi:hypothetical protein